MINRKQRRIIEKLIRNKATDVEISDSLGADVEDITNYRKSKGLLTDSEKRDRRNLVKWIAMAGASVAVGTGIPIISDYYSEDSYYNRAQNNPAAQEKWVKHILSKHSIEDLFSEVIISTPENSQKYKSEYDRNEKVRQSSADVSIYWSVGPLEELGKPTAPKPKLYVPTELFAFSNRGDLEANIAYHESNHAQALMHGLKSVGMDYFRRNSDLSKFNESMFFTVFELEGHKNHLEKGQNIMSPKNLETVRQYYLAHYAQLSRYSADLDLAATERLIADFFQPWMKSSNSVLLKEEGHQVKYMGPSQIPFVTCESALPSKICYIQFESTTEGMIKVQLPAGLARKIG